MITVRLGRWLMRRAFEKDLGLRKGYEANIAMFLNDRVKNMSPFERNSLAWSLLKLIFY